MAVWDPVGCIHHLLISVVHHQLNSSLNSSFDRLFWHVGCALDRTAGVPTPPGRVGE